MLTQQEKQDRYNRLAVKLERGQQIRKARREAAWDYKPKDHNPEGTCKRIFVSRSDKKQYMDRIAEIADKKKAPVDEILRDALYSFLGYNPQSKITNGMTENTFSTSQSIAVAVDAEFYERWNQTARNSGRGCDLQYRKNAMLKNALCQYLEKKQPCKC